MARNVQTIVPAGGIQLAPGATYDVDIDLGLTEMKNACFLLMVSYASTSGTTGVTAELHGGFGAADITASGSVPKVLGGSAVPVFSDNFDSVSLFTTPTSRTTLTTVKSQFFLNTVDVAWPRWLKIRLKNTDATYLASIGLLANI